MTAYFKILRRSGIHNGFKFAQGLNTLSSNNETFETEPTCGSGGLYFAERKDIFKWLYLYDGDIGGIAHVTLCPDSTVIEMKNKLKTDKFILGQPLSLERFINADNEQVLDAVRSDPYALKYVYDYWHTPEVCLEAVSHHGDAIQFVKKELITPEIIRTAVKMGCTNVLAFVDDEHQTPEILSFVLSEFGMNLLYVKSDKQTPALCEIAVKSNANAIQFVTNQTPALCEIAVKSNANTIKFVTNQTNELCHLAIRLLAVQKDGLVLGIIPEKERTLKMCQVAVNNNSRAIRFVPLQFQSAKLWKIAVQDCPLNLQLMTNQTSEVCLAAVVANGNALEYVKQQTSEICLAAVMANGNALAFVNREFVTPKLCMAAVQQDWMALQFVNEQTAEICALAMAKDGRAEKWVNSEFLDRGYWDGR